MDAHEYSKKFADGGVARNEKTADAATYLEMLSTREPGTVIADLNTLEACVGMITGLDIDSGDAGLFKAMGTYLKTSPAFQSADYLEDYFDLDFESADPAFQVDYTGCYTFVPVSMLPDALAGERHCAFTLARFYFEHVYTKTFLRPNLKGICLPELKLSSVTFNESRMTGSVFCGAVFSDCHFDSVRLNESTLTDCTFTGCRFDNVDLSDCPMGGATYNSCTFTGGSFRDTCLEGVTFTDCRFVATEMCGTDFGATDLGGCLFDTCWVSYARMDRVQGLTQHRLDTFFGDDSTIVPTQLKRPSFWPRQGDITTWKRWIDTGEVIESTASVSYE
ncbi:pentapeptide repeat-containing protein [Desulfoluna spongiiphila]|uniref:Uncharacterized protein YjbI, contains pentapeptide repeats n=1 Tax=Desulfoluna spongiiphila TaxID=419481 RepID=A0A1G5EIB6_9BACT|nr:pentapeptide repeat-containing protein [Desulfoluna spongiiphila]SCY26749.1 Uncharacterized protein YjbI, contains pentapeptide repeats [Desulfoluna spongiiphila]